MKPKEGYALENLKPLVHPNNDIGNWFRIRKGQDTVIFLNDVLTRGNSVSFKTEYGTTITISRSERMQASIKEVKDGKIVKLLSGNTYESLSDAVRGVWELRKYLNKGYLNEIRFEEPVVYDCFKVVKPLIFTDKLKDLQYALLNLIVGKYSFKDSITRFRTGDTVIVTGEVISEKDWVSLEYHENDDRVFSFKIKKCDLDVDPSFWDDKTMKSMKKAVKYFYTDIRLELIRHYNMYYGENAWKKEV